MACLNSCLSSRLGFFFSPVIPAMAFVSIFCFFYAKKVRCLPEWLLHCRHTQLALRMLISSSFLNCLASNTQQFVHVTVTIQLSIVPNSLLLLQLVVKMRSVELILE